jgi:hypothetical protein
LVNMPQTEAELETFRRLIRLDQPFGHDGWLAAARSQAGRRPPLRKA